MRVSIMSRKGLSNPFVANGRWRGQMPFRRVADPALLSKTLTLQRRTGEPSPAISSWYPDGYGKHEGSFTEKLHHALMNWIKKNVGYSEEIVDHGYRYTRKTYDPLVFQYRLFRHKIVTISMEVEHIAHKPNVGRGAKGFILTGKILSMDGIQVERGFNLFPIYLDRIVPGKGVFSIKMLEAPKTLLKE